MTNMPSNNNNNNDKPAYSASAPASPIPTILLHGGSLLSPIKRIQGDWAGDPVLVPRVSGSFNARVAQVVMSGLFILGNKGRLMKRGRIGCFWEVGARVECHVGVCEGECGRCEV
ncbi:uncharacterized protein BDCG_05115 [Blastomyces dermatitidis ER-3]|uniref:Uncharacterized protein n=1 Tax=Ajellomyces dermatitidis (strain ER-3 / ATCC MYA-2586) TaxID=559297 RepID=A0ABP2F076_AJEDR|nr:uncharacterized protein BDCG_05115 [Blastomyces dermatitidis ER-3]EEQ89995.2 hypothetical protein BDCG_05115 [Blastomyces dermatitidis ER-3]EQL37733.1 hypothetical protein BDFG_00782 [Blastomyces dermatitidis ATCC 26199]